MWLMDVVVVVVEIKLYYAVCWCWAHLPSMTARCCPEQ
jgi:hypothetical protein